MEFVKGFDVVEVQAPGVGREGAGVVVLLEAV